MKGRSSAARAAGSDPASVGRSNRPAPAILDRVDDALDVWADGLPTIVALGIGYLGFQKLRHLLREAVK